MALFRLWLTVVLGVAVLIAVLVLLAGCIVAPPPFAPHYAGERPYHPQWRD